MTMGRDEPMLASFQSRAPGRLDVMGGIADYSGSLVLQWPIRESTRVTLRPMADPVIRVVSTLDGGIVRACEVPLAALLPGGEPASYAEARAWFEADPARHWAAYVAGTVVVLARERGVRFTTGAEVSVESDVPEGKGVSSSAALESAAMLAVAAAWNVVLEPREAAILCQMVENLVVGAPCGVMDQVASICGEEGRLIALLCQPAEILGTVRVPPEWAVWGIDSGIRHAVTGADYGSVRTGAFMGYRVLADLAGLRVEPHPRPGHVRIDDPRWGGYLANVTPAVFAQFEEAIPETLRGDQFLRQYGGITDAITDVDPARAYAVRVPTRHPIHEHARVQAWRDTLAAIEAGMRVADAETGEWLGGLMHESHASYSACGLGSEGTDLLVDLARDAGPTAGIFGAKITGGGSGGTVALLTRAGAGDVVRRIAAEYERRAGREAYVFRGSSPGAASTGVRRT